MNPIAHILELRRLEMQAKEECDLERWTSAQDALNLLVRELADDGTLADAGLSMDLMQLNAPRGLA